MSNSSIHFIRERVTSYLGKLLLQARTATPHTSTSVPAEHSPEQVPAISTTHFLTQWRNLIPVDQWWTYCTLSTLDGFYHPTAMTSGTRTADSGSNSENEMISWSHHRAGGSEVGIAIGNGNGNAASAATASGTGAAAGSAPAGAAGEKGGIKNRKWHEKFAAQRNLNPRGKR